MTRHQVAKELNIGYRGLSETIPDFDFAALSDGMQFIGFDKYKAMILSTIMNDTLFWSPNGFAKIYEDMGSKSDSWISGE